MNNFSIKCKARNLGKAMELVKTVQKGRQLFLDGMADLDWYCEFVGLMRRSGEELGVSFKFGNPKTEGRVL